MCTAIAFRPDDFYFGRNLDFEFAYRQTVTVTPRNYAFDFRREGRVATHPALIGMAFVQGGYPLYYDATNEYGLAAAGLNFPGNAKYLPFDGTKKNVAPFEFIPYLLSVCRTVADARELLSETNVFDENFSAQLPHSPLHWMISDKKESIVAEPLAGGLRVYDDPVDVMTNNPTFDYHLTRLADFMSVSPKDPQNNFAAGLTLAPYSRGMGTIGLPGDLSSSSRFVKAAFTLKNSAAGTGETENVNQFFHILTSVEQQKGCCRVEGGYEHTIYSSCCNADKGIYYYTTYNDRRIVGVDMRREDLGSAEIVSYPLLENGELPILNGKRISDKR